MKKQIITISTLAIAAASFLASPVVHADGHESPGTIVDIAVGNDAFTTLVAAVSKAGLVDALSGKRNFTVFAPTNDAFDAAAAAVLGEGVTGPELVDALPVDVLTDILLYHVAPGERFSEDVVGAQRVRTMNKSFLFVDADSLSLLGIGSEAGLVLDLIDIEASNGVIHVIDFVLLPFLLEE